MAISAPVLPADTAASARPSRTASRLSHMLECLAAFAQRLAGLRIHGDGHVGVQDFRLGGEGRDEI